MLFSVSYLDETTRPGRSRQAREAFSTWRAIGERPATTIAVPDVPYYIDKMHGRLRRARSFRSSPRPTSRRWSRRAGRGSTPSRCTAERGSAWTLLYPQFSVVVPEPGIVKVPLAYPIAQHDEAFASFINTWIDLKRKDGTIDSLYNYWVLGRDAAPRQPRWSIIRDVLHWVE